MDLPQSFSLPVNLLAQCFNDKAATYKFYWFLSVLQEIEKGNIRPKKKELFAGMLANAWYTVHYFHISFGKQDKLQRAILKIKEQSGLFVDDPLIKIFNFLSLSSDDSVIRELNHFNNEVPWRFLSPWIKGNEKDVYLASRNFERQNPYALYDEHIEINPAWINYLQSHAGILKSFCYWKLSLYLQKHNPNVPDIPNKLIKPAKRNSLNDQRKFWKSIIMEMDEIKCIYTKDPIDISNFAVEHFIPYSFVSHDLMWNLIPADPKFNCSKTNKLPSLDDYFEDFFNLQLSAIKITQEKAPTNKFLQDYLSIFPDLKDFDQPTFKARYRETLQPLITIAGNNGFEKMSM